MNSVAGGSQDKNEILVKTEDEEYVLKGRPCELSAFSYIPPERHLPKERTYFNLDKKERYKSSTYDRLYLKNFSFEQALHRDDREHAKSKGLRVNDEDTAKSIPALSSSVYGHRKQPDLDPPDRQHYRVKTYYRPYQDTRQLFTLSRLVGDKTNMETDPELAELIDPSEYGIFDTILHYSLLLGAVFQLFCILAVVFYAPSENDDHPNEIEEPNGVKETPKSQGSLQSAKKQKLNEKKKRK
ncbi:DgyrCDS4428 [Dimorphilus gyrociliatus]|uniref:DgyrCDS4428 n=1 Tax=Dimorphilus gyrociliatus TaxID=2664684 RepID=A0A7I8VGI6_9ANNE|nr:DgyrCDS4428 [Dimorphilus gyrociliatus]